MHTRFCVCPPGVQSLFSTVLWKFYNQIPLAFSFPGNSWSLCQNLQAGKLDVGLRTFTTVGKLFWCYCSPVCGLPTYRYGVWFYCDCAPPDILLQLFPCLLYLFLVGSNIFLLMVVQQLVVISVLLQEEMSTHPPLPSWTNGPYWEFLNCEWSINNLPVICLDFFFFTKQFGLLYVSRNLSISSKLSNLLAFSSS